MWSNQEDEKGQAHNMYGKGNGKFHSKTGHECMDRSTAIALLFL
jgi:hypothetical protein